VIAPVDGICVMLDVCTLELSAAWPDPAAALLVRTALSSVFVEALLTGMPLNVKVH
jgi:hypothetical protein